MFFVPSIRASCMRTSRMKFLIHKLHNRFFSIQFLIMMPDKSGYLFFLGFNILYLFHRKLISDFRIIHHHLLEFLRSKLHCPMIKRIINFYKEGFANMKLGKTLWIVVLVKLAVIFLVIRTFFMPDILNERTSKGNEADYVSTQITDRAGL